MDSSDNEDPIHYIFTIWCTHCGHPFHSKQHGSAHFKLCPPPHNVVCGCCGNELPWKAVIRHLNSRHTTYKSATVTQPPTAIDNTYNVTCVKMMPSHGQHRFSPYSRSVSACPSASHSTVILSDSSVSTPTPLPSTPRSPTPPPLTPLPRRTSTITAATLSRHTTTVTSPTSPHTYTPFSPPPRSSAPSPALSHHSYIPFTRHSVPSSHFSNSSHSPVTSPASIPEYSLTSPDYSSSSFLQSPDYSDYHPFDTPGFPYSSPTSPPLPPLSPSLSLAADPYSLDDVLTNPAIDDAINSFMTFSSSVLPTMTSAVPTHSMTSPFQAIYSPTPALASVALTSTPSLPSPRPNFADRAPSLAAQLLWLSELVRWVLMDTRLQAVDRTARRLINHGNHWIAQLPQPMDLPLLQLIDLLTPMWTETLDSARH